MRALRRRQWKICKIGCNNIWPRMSRSTMEKSAAASRSITTERTISSGLLLLWGCGSRRDRVEYWGNGVVNLRQTSCHYSITPLLLLALTWIVFVHESCAAEMKIWEEFSGEKALAHV